MQVCSECQGYFISTEALKQHLLEHNMLRAFTSQRQATMDELLPLQRKPPPLLDDATIAHDQAKSGVYSAYIPGIVFSFNPSKGSGFLKRSAPRTPGGKVFFRISSCNVQTPHPERGEEVMFVEKRGPKGMDATSVCRRQPIPRPPARPVTNAFVQGIVTSYAAREGFGIIETAAASSLYFSIASCDIKRPPLVVGERVEVIEAAGPKGPTAGVVHRVTMYHVTDVLHLPRSSKNHAKKKKKQSRPTPSHTNFTPIDFSVGDHFTHSRAMHPFVSTPRNAYQSMLTPPAEGTAAAQSTQAIAPFSPDQYQGMLRDLSDPEEWEAHLPVAVEMLACTKPVEASHIQELDAETQRLRLLSFLDDAFDLATQNAQRTQAEADDVYAARELDFGYAVPPSPVAARARSSSLLTAPPVPELPATMYCGICMEDEPVEDAFLSSACEHVFCRDTMRTYILNRVKDAKDAAPSCPQDGCEAVLLDVDIIQVLTPDEQLAFYNNSLNAAAGKVQDMFSCSETGCGGWAVLPPEDPRFVCPRCNSEHCVQCNTKVWHEGLTCEQQRQRKQENVLHPEQLRLIYGDREDVYQCGGCSYGPIEKVGCYNMETHHDEAVGGARINNACPRCGWFAKEIDHWPRWNWQQHAAPRSPE